MRENDSDMVLAEKATGKITELIEEYSNYITKKLKMGANVSADVTALAELISASTSYKMAYRCMESGSTIR